MDQPIVSVLIVTYNHADYIVECLQSAVSQKTNFAFEIIIGEDCSKDNTRSIIKGYETQYPHLIKPIYHDRNVGMMPNVLACLAKCQGKYIACLDGDDYWTDILKLQKQVDFLEANPKYAICAHSVQILSNDTFQLSPASADTLTIKDLAKSNPLYTASVVFRNGLIKQLPAWFERSPVGDYVLHMLNAREGDIKYLPDTMAVYRKHNGGSWHAESIINVLEKWVRVISLLLTENFNDEVNAILKTQKRHTATGYLEFLLSANPAEFKVQFKALTHEDPELAAQWLDVFVDHYLKLKQISPAYSNLKNSRLRKGL
jgi:glycosyltransferase involved in cell wall biosynthesis